jgi:hypothetical protein
VSEAAEIRRQAEKLQARFKQTGIVDPTVSTWEPKPTAGDHARALGNEIQSEREQDIQAADEAARMYWDT